MADSDSIMQLGVAAARDGNREEARNLFRLLTRQEPDNAQAWLWLAGVAEGREERQAALERVLELDPDSEMAQKGLAALGVDVAALKAAHAARPAQPIFETPDTSATAAASAAASASEMRSRYDIDDDDPFAQLDTLSDAMNESQAVRRAQLPPDDDPYSSLDEMSDAMSGTSAVRRDEGTRPIGEKPRYTTPPRTSTRTARTTSSRRVDVDEDGVPRRRTSPLLLALLGVLLAVLLLWMLSQLGLFSGLFGDGEQVADTAPTTVVEPTADGGGVGPAVEPTVDPAAQPTGDGAAEPTADPNAPVPNAPTIDPAAPAATAAPAPAAPAAPAPDLSAANPAPVAPGTPLESAGGTWTFNFPTASYANTFVGPIGGIAPTGRFVVVLTTVNNNSGQPQSIPAGFFVLKDAQGRIYEARPDVSTAYVDTFGRGLAADLSMADEIPADGLTRSVPLMFDVAPDATNLVLFAADNPGQGYQVLSQLQ
jgi:hypothetical protein